MEFIPRSLGTRPRLACEVRAEGVVAARAEDAFAVLSAVVRVPLTEEIVVPRLTAVEADGAATGSATNDVSSGVGGDPAGRAAVVAAVRKALDAVCLRTREVTLIVPDASARVLLLDFDELPAKPAEALPVVRFRLKKLLPFDADDAAVSYQVMATAKDGLQVLAVAMPRELLADYESVVREAGFEPGAILPSTLAALSGLGESAAPALVVNAGRDGVTTAIVKAGVLLLHRTVDLGADLRADQQADQRVADQRVADQRMAAQLLDAAAAQLAASANQAPPDEHEQAPEQWARQEPVSFSEQNDDAIAVETELIAEEITEQIAQEIVEEIAEERSLTDRADEVAQAVSVAAAYFEDTLQTPPSAIHAAGTLGAAALTALLKDAHVGPLAVREMLHSEMLGAGASLAGTLGAVPLGWLAGVRGALAN
jgi:type IV pilus assembly protein PilM